MATSLDSLIQCPDRTRFWILNLGTLEADAAWFIRGGSTSTLSNPNPTNERRKLTMYAILIDHPTEGLILWETGGGKNYPELAGAPVNDIFAKVDEDPVEELDAQIEKCGFKISDIKMVILGHLHMDHSGGLLYFEGTNIPIIVHELEIKNAFYSVATGYDVGAYLPYYLKLDFNWQAWTGETYEIAQGITLRHSPGHTPGLAVMQLNMKESGTWIITTDMYHVKENYYDNAPQGFLARDHHPWVNSNQKIHALQRRTNAKMLFGHCKETLSLYKTAPHAYE